MENKTSYEKELKALGNNIRFFREQAGISQETLSFRAGLHRNYISSLELAQKNPTYTTLLKLSKALNVSLIELVTIRGE
ncbi:MULTISPECIES: helix-turn-helix transcriptional regulator [unclassified Lysinibacillus]|uniref:helix-turn-helix domain-containing protein n=1 Tax=unclassified Lysinibacillus TaxID=2636778 RepID=UPI00088835BB|nr:MULTISPECIES: helix-turn-helix transcriptional regulator [unclassified Lysinibacillus]SCY87201.1 Helix-turn-helix [Lysinibacillus sp. SG9]SDB38349.1 Helix-turn-helix [Lysinibacillus sp. TC-37]SFT02367.1 Helix-turn-helix [Lysinibacillus sp. SG55]